MRFVQMIATVARPVVNVRVRMIEVVASFANVMSLRFEAGMFGRCCRLAAGDADAWLATAAMAKRHWHPTRMPTPPRLVPVTSGVTRRSASA